MAGPKAPISLTPKGSFERGPRMPGFHRARGAVGGFALPMPVIDPQIVRRSAYLRGDYPERFSYRQYLRVKSRLQAASITGSVAAVALGAQLGPVRKRLVAAKASGTGPSPETRAQSSFRVDFFATQPNGQSVQTRVSGGDPGYDETSKMLGECAGLLVFEEGERRSGVLTPAAAFGESLQATLQARNIRFEVLRGP